MTVREYSHRNHLLCGSIKKLFHGGQQILFSNSSTSQSIKIPNPSKWIKKSQQIPVHNIIVGLGHDFGQNFEFCISVMPRKSFRVPNKNPSIFTSALPKRAFRQYIFWCIIFSQYNQYIPVQLSIAGHPDFLRYSSDNDEC